MMSVFVRRKSSAAIFAVRQVFDEKIIGTNKRNYFIVMSFPSEKGRQEKTCLEKCGRERVFRWFVDTS